MCDLNGPFRLCTCSGDIDYSKPHWILRMNNINEGEDMMVDHWDDDSVQSDRQNRETKDLKAT